MSAGLRVDVLARLEEAAQPCQKGTAAWGTPPLTHQRLQGTWGLYIYIHIFNISPKQEPFPGHLSNLINVKAFPELRASERAGEGIWSAQELSRAQDPAGFGMFPVDAAREGAPMGVHLIPLPKAGQDKHSSSC